MTEFYNVILQGDALDRLRELPDNCCDIFTDPPYNVGKNYGEYKDNREDYPLYITDVLTECKRVANVLTVYVPKKWNLLYWNVLGTDFQEIIMPNRILNGFCYGFVNQYGKLLTNAKPEKAAQVSNCWENMQMPGTGYFFRENTYDHPGYTSEAITNRVIAQLCTSDIICDPFMGTGTTAVAARKLQKNYLGIELNPAYIKLAEKRIACVSEHLFAPEQPLETQRNLGR